MNKLHMINFRFKQPSLATTWVMKKNINKKYTKLLIKAQNVTKRNDAILLIKKAKKLQDKFALTV